MPRRLIAVLLVLAGLGLKGRAWGISLTLEIRGGYQSPQAADFREIYGGGLAFGAQIEARLTKSLSAWAGAEYFGKTGTITFTGEETKIWIVPLTAGLKVRLTASSLRPYLAAGLGGFIYSENNVLGSSDGVVFGFLGQAGLEITLTPRLSLDLFGRYATAKTEAREPEILGAELGGFQGGVGLVYRF